MRYFGYEIEYDRRDVLGFQHTCFNSKIVVLDPSVNVMGPGLNRRDGMAVMLNQSSSGIIFQSCCDAYGNVLFILQINEFHRAGSNSTFKVGSISKKEAVCKLNPSKRKGRIPVYSNRIRNLKSLLTNRTT